jgi:N-acetyl-gamma-glutamyl-phosphate reductase
MKPKVFIDGHAGTTGLQIYERLAVRTDIELLTIPEAGRKDAKTRADFLNAANLVFLCLPDGAAREAVALITNPGTRVIDASTAHRTAAGWVYGFSELRSLAPQIPGAKRVANPGCHATGFLSLAAPLTEGGLLPRDYPLSCFSLTGYSGGGKPMIAEYETPERDESLRSPALYALPLTHKHLPEMQTLAGLDFPPAFTPVAGDFYAGMATAIQLHTRLLPGRPAAAELHGRLSDYYAGSALITVLPFGGSGSRLHAGTLAGKDRLEITVSGNETAALLCANFDNLGKGASGAAVQNMNLMLGFDETASLFL